jgi:hypothetical protein
MTTLPERLKELASRMNQDGDKYDAFTLLAEAVQALQAAPEGGDTMRGVCESADFEADTLTFRMVGAYYAAAGEYVITPAAPSPTAALQAGEV